MKDIVLKYVLHNSIKYNGKPSEGAVLGHIFSQNPNLKPKIKELREEIKKTIKEVSKKSAEEQLETLKKIAPELLEEKKPEEKKLAELKNAKQGKVVMRFEPSPSGPLHIGHAFVLALNYAYSRIYDGKFIIRISDTNPENIDPQSYNLIEEDAKWLTNNGVSEFMIQSDRMDIYYRYAEKLVEMEKAYVCTCSSEAFKELADKMEPCPCRNISKEENIKRWKMMFKEYKPGEAVLRIKTDIKHKNPAMRDWPAMRINEFKHPRKGEAYRVWPLMSFSVVIDDMDTKMTHLIRGKDHMDNAKKQEYVYNYLDKPIPESLFFGRINFEGMEVSCSQTRLRIESGEFTGWDDIRLPFLAALRRRGYQPEAFIKFATDTGVSPVDKTIKAEEYFKLLDAYNRDIIDPKSNRYFFINDPVEVEVKDAPEHKVEIDVHPDRIEMGKRVFKAHKKFFITKNDFNSMKDNYLYRLMDCLNLTKIGKELVFDSIEYDRYKKGGEKIIHWLPVEKELVEVVVLMPDAKTERGFGEAGIKKLKPGDICQFERFGFVRLDEVKEGKYHFWFTHK